MQLLYLVLQYVFSGENELFFLNNIPRYLYSETVSKAILSKVNV